MSRRNTPLMFVLVGALSLVVVASTPWTAEGQSKPKKRLSQREMKKKMKGWARMLGVKCSYCHIKEGEEYDYEAETPAKAIADHCEEQFVDRLTLGKKAVTCQDCHNKKPKFLPRPAEEGEEGQGE